MTLSAKDRQGITIILAVVVAFAGLLVASQTLKAPKRDANGCLPSGWTSSTVILLDHSEGIPVQTAHEIEARAVDFINRQVSTNDHVSLYAVSDESARALIPLYEGCKPPSAGNALTESDKSIRRQFDRNFMNKLRKALRQEFPDSATSPIAQAISDLSNTTDLKAEKLNLLIFSDMIENSPSLDMYRCSPDTDPRKLYRNANAGAIERPTFKNVSVHVNVIPRRGLSPGTLHCRSAFWPWLLGDDAGPSAGVTLEYLPG